MDRTYNCAQRSHELYNPQNRASVHGHALHASPSLLHLARCARELGACTVRHPGVGRTTGCWGLRQGIGSGCMRQRTPDLHFKVRACPHPQPPIYTAPPPQSYTAAGQGVLVATRGHSSWTNSRAMTSCQGMTSSPSSSHHRTIPLHTRLAI